MDRKAAPAFINTVAPCDTDSKKSAISMSAVSVSAVCRGRQHGGIGKKTDFKAASGHFGTAWSIYTVTSPPHGFSCCIVTAVESK